MTQVLLLGDSLVADHNWQQRMPAYKVFNLGIPGEMTSDLLASLPEIKEQRSYAEIVMVAVGTNDLLTGNYKFIHSYKKLLVLLTQHYPGAEVLACSLLPMELSHLPANTVSSLNCHIEALTMQTGCCYLDIHKRVAQTEKKIFQEDGIHITETAYEIWTRALLEHIAFLIEDD